MHICAKDGVVKSFIPGIGADPDTLIVGEGVAADFLGNVYWAETSGGMTVYVFDKDSKKLVGYQTVQGGEPPSQTSTPAGSDDFGSKPTQQIVDFLKAAAGR